MKSYPLIKLTNGVHVPQIGLGVYQVAPEEVYDTVTSALEVGYRHIDTASYYGNEAGVGQAIGDSSVRREDIFVTTKVWNDEQGYEQTLTAFEKSLERLGIDYIDLYLIHWPIEGLSKDTWQAMEDLYKKGKVKAIGVSNFLEHHLSDLMKSAEIMPMVNQIELHPKLIEQQTIDFCQANNIVIQAWSPIGRARYLDEPILVEIANKYNKTAAQVILRWHIENDFIIIPRSINKERQQENISLFDFQLTKNEIVAINELDSDGRIGPHPDEMAKS